MDPNYCVGATSCICVCPSVGWRQTNELIEDTLTCVCAGDSERESTECRYEFGERGPRSFVKRLSATFSCNNEECWSTDGKSRHIPEYDSASSRDEQSIGSSNHEERPKKARIRSNIADVPVEAHQTSYQYVTGVVERQ